MQKAATLSWGEKMALPEACDAFLTYLLPFKACRDYIFNASTA
jgi:hypothetical protein